MENIRIYLLGTFRFYRDGVLLTARDWQIRHARQLFKLLFTERGHTVPASKVIDLLWPYSAEHTHKTLRGVVSILRSVLEPGRSSGEASRFVPRGSQGYTLVLPTDGTVWVDTIEFERLLDEPKMSHESPKWRRSLESALQLYAGDYLAEDENESWTLTERARLRERYFATVLSLMELQHKLGLWSEAIAVGRRALSFDSCREPLYPIIMHCQIALGDTVGALQTFEQCRQELHNRLGVDPSPQTLKLHTELLRGELRARAERPVSLASRQVATPASPAAPAVPAASATPGLPGLPGSSSESGAMVAPVQHTNGARKHAHEPHLIGRKEAMDYLLHYTNALLDKQARPKTRTIALVGEMGVGKSLLLRSLLSRVRSAHIMTMFTSCQVMEQSLPFAPLLAMVKVWLADLSAEALEELPGSVVAALAHLLPELQRRVPKLLPMSFLNAEQAYNGYITAFVDLFQAISLQRPLIIAVDDLQWADEASLLVMHRLARTSTVHVSNGHAAPQLLLLAYRPEDVLENIPLHTMQLSLSQCSYFHSLHLSRFSLDEVAEYLNAHDVDRAFAPSQIYRVTRGNALFLAEATRLLLDQKEHDAVARAPSLHDYLLATLPRAGRLHDVILARVNHLPERAVELLEHAAVIGRPFPPNLLGPMLSPEDYKLLDTLLSRGFLVEGSGKDYDVYLSFSYELVAKIIYSCCSALRRSLLHLQTAEQLVRCDSSDFSDSTDLQVNSHAAEIAFHYRHAGSQYQAQALQYETKT